MGIRIFSCNGERRGTVSPFKVQHTRGGGAAVINKAKIGLWVLRNSRIRGLIIKGLKKRRVRRLAWAVAKRRIRRSRSG